MANFKLGDRTINNFIPNSTKMFLNKVAGYCDFQEENKHLKVSNYVKLFCSIALEYTQKTL